MDVYLSGFSNLKNETLSGKINPRDIMILESFFYLKDWEIPFIPQFKKFILDSGAASFIYGTNKNNKINWDEYAEKYAYFVKENNVKLFFELDIDNVIGLKKVEELRKKIETITNSQCIPVWHKERGKEYYLQMCQNYKYIAIGGLVNKKNKTKTEKYFPWFIKKAHEYGCKIHGLGYTDTKKLSIFHFDSVDSTSWNSAQCYGQLNYFNGKYIDKINSKEKGLKIRDLKDYKIARLFNFEQWVKYQKYMENL